MDLSLEFIRHRHAGKSSILRILPLLSESCNYVTIYILVGFIFFRLIRSIITKVHMNERTNERRRTMNEGNVLSVI